MQGIALDVKGGKRRLESGEDGTEEGGSKKAKAYGGLKDELDDGELLRRAIESGDIDEETMQKLLAEADKAQVVSLDTDGLKQMLLSLEKKVRACVDR